MPFHFLSVKIVFFAMVSRPGDEPAWSLCSREICGSGRTSRTSFGGQKVEAILHRDPLRLREKRVLASCLNAKEGNMPWQRLPDLHRYCGSQSPVCYCYTKPPCCRVSPASTKNHEYESQKDRGACLSRLSTLSLGDARLSGLSVNLYLSFAKCAQTSQRGRALFTTSCTTLLSSRLRH